MIQHRGNVQNEVAYEEHAGEVNAKKTIATPLTYYAQSSLVSGYVYHGFALPGSNPTTSVFRIQRESLNTGEVLFANGNSQFVNIWSAASLASISFS